MASHQTVKSPQSPWLAISFGCCASSDPRESEDEVGLRGPSTEMQICYDQPRIVPPPRVEAEYPPRPATSHSMSRHLSQWASHGREVASRASIRTSFSTLNRPWTSHSRARPSIGLPTDFRRFDGLDGFDSMVEEAPEPIRRRRSFRPLELSIYLPENRLSPLPDFRQAEWNKLPAELEIPAQARVRQSLRTNSIASSASSYMIQRKPVGSVSNRSSMQSAISRPTSVLLHQEEPRTSEYLANTSIQRTNTQSSRLTSPLPRITRLPSPSRVRSNTEPASLLARRGSIRRARTDVDEAIRELNTIVEERRADALRSTNPSPSFPTQTPHHIPAIAPSLRMHVRSETLSDIGSAFSVPLSSATKVLPTTPEVEPQSPSTVLPQPTSHKQTKLRLVPPPIQRASTAPGPLNSNPITPPTPTIPTPTTPIARLGAWLRRSIPSTPTTPSFSLKSVHSHHSSPLVPPVPFYQCNIPGATLTRTLPKDDNDSRPSTSRSSSCSVSHARHDSNDTATLTLTSYPSTPALSSRTASPEPMIWSPGSPETPANELSEVGLRAARERKSALSEKEVEGGMGLGGIRLVRSPGYEETAPMWNGPSPVSPVGVAF